MATAKLTDDHSTHYNVQLTVVWSPMEVNLHTRLDRDSSHRERHTSQPTSPVQPRDAKGNPLLPLMTVFPATGYLAPHLQPVVKATRPQAVRWIPVAVPLSSISTQPSGGSDGKHKPPVNPLIPITDLDPGCILHVRSRGRRGIPLSEINVAWVEQEPNEHGVVYREGLVGLGAVRGVVDYPDWCVCHLVRGPTVRIAGIGAEWRGSFVEQPGYPVQKQGSECFTFGKLFQLVVEHFLTWWINEKESRAKRISEEVRQLERLRVPLVPGPGTIPLENVVLVAIRRRHIALGVYEWSPEIEVTL
ncbi:hypothetical protein LXA43DRAFT_529814 [Ganoderma leucocontextum]|nr:hypothetical protein LXA43DRAFT_529814 [Ganoderma leucocontextum]